MADEKPLVGSQLAVFKFCETSKNSLSHSNSIFNGAKQWRNLQSSLLTVHDSLLSRLSDSELTRRGNCGGIDVRREFVDLGQKLKTKTPCLDESDEFGDKHDLIELYEKLCDDIDSKEKRVKEECARLECRHKLIDDARKASEFLEVGIKEKCEALEVKEKRLNEECLRLEGKEKSISDARRELELREVEINAKCEAFESEKKDMNDHKKVLEEREVDLDMRCAKIVAKEKCINEECLRLEGKEKSVDDTRRELELKEVEMKKKCEVLESKEKDVDRRCARIETLERDLLFRLKKLDKLSNMLVVQEKEAKEYRKVLELKEKNLLGKVELKEKLIDERCAGIKAKEMDFLVRVSLIEKEMEERSKEINSNEEKVMTEICKGVQWKLRQMNDHFDVMEMEERRKRKRVLGEDFGRERIKEVNGRLRLQGNEVSECCIEQEKEENRVEVPCEELGDIEPRCLIEKQINESSDELKSKGEKEVEAQCEDSESMAPQVNEYKKSQPPQGLMEKQISETSDNADQLELKKNKQGNAPCDDFELIGTQVNEYNEAPAIIEKKTIEFEDKLELKKGKEGEKPCEDLKLMGTQVNVNGKPQGLTEKQMNEPIVKLELNHKEVSEEALELKTEHDNDFTSQLKTKGAQISNEDGLSESKQKGDNVPCCLTQPENALPHSVARDIVCGTAESSSTENDSDIHMMCQKMDVNGVRSYMIRCVKENSVLPDKIFDALRCAPDPTKLVLEISKSFFEAGLDKSDNVAIKWSCIHLLEQLIKLSPSITSDVEHEARNFAAVWLKTWICAAATPINCFGFLHFVAAYKLTKHYYRGNNLLSIFKSSYLAAKLSPPEKNVDLSRVLEVQDKIPDYIGSLIKKQKLLEAIKCIYLFKLESDFPPVPLLEAYLERVKQKVDTKLKTWNSQEKLDPAAVELSHLHDALHSIQQLKLEFMLPTDSLSLRIKQLKEEMKGTSRKRDANSVGTPVVLLKKRPRLESVMVTSPQSREGGSNPVKHGIKATAFT